MAQQILNPPEAFSSLKDAAYWDVEFCNHAFPNATFRFYILQKVRDGHYLTFAWADSAEDAFKLRREMAREMELKLFVRGKRLKQSYVEREVDEDAYRDAMLSGDSSHIPASQRQDFNSWASRVINERPEYARRNRDQPRWSNR
ncbi:hypothetical protein OAL13_00085 [bacterium]|nr:hypothetical protein [bacterium]